MHDPIQLQQILGLERIEHLADQDGGIVPELAKQLRDVFVRYLEREQLLDG